MTKRFFIALLAAAALVAVGCQKDDDQNSDLVGEWEWDYGDAKATLVFKAKGSYSETKWGETTSGKWSLKNDVITMTPEGGEASEAKVVLSGEKTWLTFVNEYISDNPYNEGEKIRSFENYRKVGAKVKSPALSNGRWDAPDSGYAPEEYTSDVDYNCCMVIDGNKVDLYVIMWGLHIQGTFTLSDGKMHIETDDDHIWKAYYIGDGDSPSFGWYAGEPPYDVDTWDSSYGSMNAETFQVQAPYHWYTITETLAMGTTPEKSPELYKEDPFHFKFRIYDEGLNYRDIALDLCDFDLCVSDDGKEAYGGPVNKNPWLYKR